MKINKENDIKKNLSPQELDKLKGYIDTAKMDVQCHIVIKDKDSGEILVNKRG